MGAELGDGEGLSEGGAADGAEVGRLDKEIDGSEVGVGLDDGDGEGRAVGASAAAEGMAVGAADGDACDATDGAAPDDSVEGADVGRVDG